MGFAAFCSNRSRSLPSRERGLKFEQMGKLREATRSLPSRERGLKYMAGQ